MRKFLMTAIFVVGCGAFPALAKPPGNFGLGFEVGNPTALSAKLWLSGVNALDFAFGYNAHGDWLFVKGDYLWHSFNLIPVSSGQLPLYYGMGAIAGLTHRPAVGLEGVVGLEYILPSAPLDVFLEIAPGAYLVPETDSDISGGLGMRFYF